jgi:hypothetical protein
MLEALSSSPTTGGVGVGSDKNGENNDDNTS